MARATLVEFFRDFSGGGKTFLAFDDGFRTWSYSYEQVTGAAARFAERLTSAGITRGEKVILWGENRPEWIAAFWGCVLAGVVVVPVDYRASRELLERIAGIVDARAVVAGDEVPALPGHWRMAEFDWSAGTLPSASQATATQAGDLCEILFTSGATAEPKGVTITHANLLANIVPVETEIRKHRRWSIPFAPIRFLNLLPLSHLFGQSMATFIPPVLNGEVIFMAGFNPREIVRQIQSRKVSVLVSVPRILEVLREYVTQTIPEAAEPPPAGANWMRRWWHYRRVHNLFGWKFWCFVVGAAPLEPALEEFWGKLGFLVVQGYGLTETAPIVTLNHPFHTSKGSVGKPIGGVEVRIAEDGEILVRGANVTAGYFVKGERAAEEDAIPTAGGWFHTGDIGSMDEEGRVFVRGRKKEMIVTPEGLNVFPEDVERVLNATPGVRDAAVVGPDRVHAVLVLDAGMSAERVAEEANARLESHQQIRGVSVWPEAALPRTEGTQKLKRMAVAEWVAGRAGPERAKTAGELLGGYADDVPLAQLGLSSLDRVELMMGADQSMTDAAFEQATTVGELRRMARRAVAASSELVAFPRWNRSAAARALRRAALPAILIPLLKIFVRLAVGGRENLPRADAPVLFAVNHQSIFDVPTVLAALPPEWRYRVASAMGADWFRPHFHPANYGWRERFGNNLQYYLACLFFNAFPLPQHEAGARESLRYIGELASEGWAVLIFPEGVRTAAGEIAPFRPGIGMMGSRLSLPVVGVRIEGLDRVLHQSWRWPKRGRVTVRFAAPVELRGDDYGALAGQVEALVREMGAKD